MNARFARAVSARTREPAYRSRARLAFDVRLGPKTRWITARGELDCASVARLSDVISVQLELEPGDITIDIGRVTFVDAAVLGCLVGFDNDLAAHGHRLIMMGATPRVRRVFALVALTALLDAA